MQKHKSILIIANYPPPYGGVPRHIEYLVPYLVKKGWDVHVFSGGRSGTQRIDGFTVYKPNLWIRIFAVIISIFESKRKNNIKLKSFSLRSIVKYLRYEEYISFARRIIEKNNIKIISAYNLFSFGPVGAALSEEYNIPLIITNFGEIYQDQNYAKNNYYLIEYICKIAKKFLAMSKHCAESYKIVGLSPEVEVIPYGVDIKKFFSTDDGFTIKEQLGLSDKDPIVLYVGRLINDMGLHTLLESIPHILKEDEKIKFLIVGEKGELLSDVMQLRKKYVENIFVITRVSFDRLPYYYDAATLVVAPTRSDRACGSLASIEAMACGKAVIASNVGGIPEIVIDGVTGFLIDPENAVELAKKVLGVINNIELLKKMGTAGRERVEKYFNEENTDEKIEQIFEKLLESNQ